MQPRRANARAVALPASLKARIGGRLGHLSNDTAAQILASCAHAGLQHLVAAHERAEQQPRTGPRGLAPACGAAPDEIIVADPAAGFGWLDIR